MYIFIYRERDEIWWMDKQIHHHYRYCFAMGTRRSSQPRHLVGHLDYTMHKQDIDIQRHRHVDM